MRKRLVAIYSVLVVIVLLAVLAMSCEPTEEESIDASITFVSWTINGTLVDPGAYNVTENTTIGVIYTVYVDGPQGEIVPVAETCSVTINYTSGESEPDTVHSIDADSAFSMAPEPVSKAVQESTIDGHSAPYCTNADLFKGEPMDLGVGTMWELGTGTSYTNSIDWLGIVSSNETVFALPEPIPSPKSYELVAQASIDVDEDVNPANNSVVASPALLISVKPITIP
jgi:hypothetical protein